jgi:hypothetical protein
MKFEYVKLFRNMFFVYALMLIGYKINVSYNNYRSGKHHRLEVYDRTKTKRVSSETKIISNGEVKPNFKSIYIIQENSFWQYLILDFNPDEDSLLPFSFLFNYLMISLIVFYSLRKSDNKRIFTKELVEGLSHLKFYVIFMMIATPIPYTFFRNYIAGISNHDVLYIPRMTFNASYVFYYVGAIILIFLLREALKLQEEQDLTV